jgi:hypothetical protein
LLITKVLEGVWGQYWNIMGILMDILTNGQLVVEMQTNESVNQ